ncbi:MAG: DUF6142 family protein [Lachnospiraceae bacterium]|nr:DUF6142 family protein [Lachnospiraceae bacterium]
MFTNKDYSNKGIMSTILGMISIGSICLAVYLTYQNHGQAEFRYGSAALLTLLFAGVGMGLGVASRMEKDKFYLFTYLGITFNFVALAAISFILYAGAYGL